MNKQTFIHSSEKISQVFCPDLRLVLLPCVAVIAPQHNQLPLLPPHGAEMRDLHYDGTGTRKSSVKGQMKNTS